VTRRRVDPTFSRRTALDRTPNDFARALPDPGAPPLLDLTVSNPTRVGLEETAVDLAGILATLGPEAGRYAPDPLGDLRARTAVASDLAGLDRRVPRPPGDVFLTASTSEAYAILFQVLADPGEGILVPRPSYPLLEHLTRFAGLIARPYPLLYDGDRWVVDPAGLQAAARGSRARAVVAVSPNNPTGDYLSAGDVETLAAPGLPLIVDEVFRHPPLSAASAPPPGPAMLLGERHLVCSLGGASKHVALPQGKVAWTEVTGPEAPRRELLGRVALVADAQLSLAPPLAAALPELLAQGRRARRGLADRLRGNLAALHDAIGGSPLSFEGHPEAGWTAVIRAPDIVPEDGWAIRLLREDGVRVQPGWLYDLAPGRLVISLLTPPEAFSEGMARIVRRVTSCSCVG